MHSDLSKFFFSMICLHKYVAAGAMRFFYTEVNLTHAIIEKKMLSIISAQQEIRERKTEVYM